MRDCARNRALTTGQDYPFFAGSPAAILTFCFLSFFARLAIPASCFFVLCFVRLAFSI